MSLMEVLTLVAVLISLFTLLISVVSVTFTITWTISCDKKDNNKTKK